MSEITQHQTTAEIDSIDVPHKGFIDSYGLYTTRRPSVTLAVQRNVTAPLMFRNTDNESAETQVFDDITRAQANPEKFITKERLTGLDLLRALDDSEDLISGEYRHNEPPALEEAINLDSLTYGMAGTGDNDYGMKSRVVTGYSYSIEEYSVTDVETRNKVFESGTMTDEEGEQSQGLFEEARIKPGNAFVQFLTVEAATPGMLAYVMHNMLNTGGYGARETRSGKTLDNSIRAAVIADHPVRLANAELLTDYGLDTASDDAIGAALQKYLTNAARADWDVYGDEGISELESFPEWFEGLHNIAAREQSDARTDLREMFVTDTQAAFKSIEEADG